MTDLRMLCAELVEKLDELNCNFNVPNQSALIERSCTALAQLESQGPTDEDVVAACPFDSFHEPAEYHGWWSAIEWMEQRWGRPVIEPVPVSELVDLAYELRKTAKYLQGGCGWIKALDAIERAATLIESGVLTRLGRPAVEPVPVSERLPGPEDCDAEGRCWLLCRSASMNRTPTWRLVHRRSILDAPYTHWLPHWALPVPRSEVSND